MSKFIKPIQLYQDEDGESGKPKEGRELQLIDCDKFENHKKLIAIDIGTRARTLVLNVSEEKRKILRMELKKFFVVAATYLQKNLPLNSSLLRDLHCLHPLKRQEMSANAISRLALIFGEVLKGRIANVFGLKNGQTKEELCDLVRKQWQMYQVENIPKTFYLKEAVVSCDQSVGDQQSLYRRIDGYWDAVGKIKDEHGADKFPQLFALAKCCLTLSHGNATPERGFSINKALLEKNRLPLGEDTIVALRLVKDAIHTEDSIGQFPITRALLSNCKDAHKKYISYQEELKKVKEQKKKAIATKAKAREENQNTLKRKAEDEVAATKLRFEIEDQKTTLKIADEIVAEGNDKLKEALSKRSLIVNKEKIQKAQSLISIGVEKQTVLRASLAALESELSKMLMPNTTKLLKRV